MIHDKVADPSPPELASVFEFRDSRTGERLAVSLATLLQCLCIAEQRHLVPPLEADWEVQTFPPSLRELSRLET